MLKRSTNSGTTNPTFQEIFDQLEQVFTNFTKIVLTYLKFEAEGQEFAKFLRSLDQFVPTVKGQNYFW